MAHTRIHTSRIAHRKSVHRIEFWVFVAVLAVLVISNHFIKLEFPAIALAEHSALCVEVFSMFRGE